MLTGITYDLKNDYLQRGFTPEQVAEFDCEETIDAIQTALEEDGHTVDKIGCLENLTERLRAGDRWDLVFNIAEGMYGIGREAQVPALLDAYRIPYTFSKTETLAVCLDKGMTNAVLRGMNVPVSDFAIVREQADVKNVHMPFPLFAKPIAEGTSKGITAKSVIHNRLEMETQCAALLSTFHQPVLIETYLPGREFTVGILGSGEQARVLGVMEVLLNEHAEQSGYTYDNKQQYQDCVRYKVTDNPAVAKVALSGWKALNCLDAGRVDVRLDAGGSPRLMEINPLAGLNPRYSDLCILCRRTGFPYNKLIQSIARSALRRNGLA